MIALVVLIGVLQGIMGALNIITGNSAWIAMFNFFACGFCIGIAFCLFENRKS